MTQKLVKSVVSLGNSACVILPKGWRNGKARVELIEEPLDIKRDALEILEPYLDDVRGIYLIGSYARGEQTENSDVDILVITGKTNKSICSGNYEITLISQDALDKLLKKNILPLLPMLKEAKTILNDSLIKGYKKFKPYNSGLNWANALTKSSQGLNDKALGILRELKENVSDGVMYSVILNLRNVYTIDSLKNNRTPTTKGLKNLIKSIAGTEEPYEAYLRSKKKSADKKNVSLETAEKINEYVRKKLS